MNFIPQFRRTSNPHTFLQEQDTQAIKTPEGVLMERPETITQPAGFAYIATTNSALEESQGPVVSKDNYAESESETQQAQDAFLGELLGLLFLIAFHGSVFVLKHVYVFSLTMLSYVDRNVEQKYLTRV